MFLSFEFRDAARAEQARSVPVCDASGNVRR